MQLTALCLQFCLAVRCLPRPSGTSEERNFSHYYFFWQLNNLSRKHTVLAFLPFPCADFSYFTAPVSNHCFLPVKALNVLQFSNFSIFCLISWVDWTTVLYHNASVFINAAISNRFHFLRAGLCAIGWNQCMFLSGEILHLFSGRCWRCCGVELIPAGMCRVTASSCCWRRGELRMWGCQVTGTEQCTQWHMVEN